MPHTVIYHKNCMDGLAAALAVRQWLFDNNRMTGAKFITAQYGDAPVEERWIAGREVVLVDFSYPRDVLLAMHQQAKSLVVIDHHETAQANLAGLDFCVFDMTKSGAVLAWEYFHPDKHLPLFMRYVQDRDLWQWQLPFSREVSAALQGEKPFLDQMARFLDDDQIPGLVGVGAPILRYQSQVVSRTLYNGVAWVDIAGHHVPVLNTTTMISEIGEALLVVWADVPFVAMYFDTADGKRVFSLRTNRERIEKTGVKVNDVAKAMGGGGHPEAAGFSVPAPGIL